MPIRVNILDRGIQMIPLFRVTITIYRMALHFCSFGFVCAGGKKKRREEERWKGEGRVRKGNFFLLENGMIEEVKHTSLEFRDITGMLCRK
jgi:hypothetical protein